MRSLLAFWLGGGAGVPVVPPAPIHVGVHLEWGTTLLLAALADRPSGGTYDIPEPAHGPVQVDWGQTFIKRRMGR